MSTAPKKRENLLLNLVFNIAIPSLILSKLSKEHLLGPVWGLIVALAFPLGYAVWDFVKRKEVSFLSGLSIVAIVATGVLGLYKASLIWFAIKEACLPLVIGVGILISAGTKQPLVNTLLYSDDAFDKEKINAALEANAAQSQFKKAMMTYTYWLAGINVIGAWVNFVLTPYFLVSEPGTAEFNDELGRMTRWSWLIITAPMMIVTMGVLFSMVKKLTKLTGLKTEELMREHENAKQK